MGHRTAVVLLTVLLAACGTLYHHETDVHVLPGAATSGLAVGDGPRKVHALLGEPLVGRPELGFEVYRRHGRDIDVGWVIAPWVPILVFGDRATAVILVRYDDRGRVRTVASELWEETRYRFGGFSLDADGFTFLNINRREPSTLLGPPVSLKDLATLLSRNARCSLLFVMDRCPMETIRLDQREIADFPYTGAHCEVEDDSHQPVNHPLYETLLWIETAPGQHAVEVDQRLRAGTFEAPFACGPGEIVAVSLRGHRLTPDAWHGRRLEGALRVTQGAELDPAGIDGARFILWHDGNWFGSPNLKYLGSE